MKVLHQAVLGMALFGVVASTAQAGGVDFSLSIGIPVYGPPPVVYSPPPVVYSPPPVYYAPPPAVYYSPVPYGYYGPPFDGAVVIGGFPHRFRHHHEQHGHHDDD